jgi:hypothetical protein
VNRNGKKKNKSIEIEPKKIWVQGKERKWQFVTSVGVP